MFKVFAYSFISALFPQFCFNEENFCANNFPTSNNTFKACKNVLQQTAEQHFEITLNILFSEARLDITTSFPSFLKVNLFRILFLAAKLFLFPCQNQQFQISKRVCEKMKHNSKYASLGILRHSKFFYCNV